MGDPLNSIVADGRIRRMPIDHFGFPDIITVDLEALHANIREWLNSLFVDNKEIRIAYLGTKADVTAMIKNDINSYCDFLIGQTYNKLRSILQKYPNQRSLRMNTRCPVPKNQEFPRWIVSTLSSIGPLHIEDGPRDRYVCFASTTATMQFHGRVAAPKFIYGGYSRLHEALKKYGVEMSPFDHISETGSFYPTVELCIEENLWRAFGAVHSSHYVNEDFIRAVFVSSATGKSPFENIGMRIGYVDDWSTLNALTAVAAPVNIPAGQNSYSPGLPVGPNLKVNHYGIQPAANATGDTPACTRGIYIIGRGMERYYQCSLAQNVASAEIARIIAYRFLGGRTPPPGILCKVCQLCKVCPH
ncbi:ORF1 [Rhodiola cryptic virus 1]|nr:ORF1 [Rhodiola cryptic virus 1]